MPLRWTNWTWMGPQIDGKVERLSKKHCLWDSLISKKDALCTKIKSLQSIYFFPSFKKYFFFLLLNFKSENDSFRWTLLNPLPRDCCNKYVVLKSIPSILGYLPTSAKLLARLYSCFFRFELREISTAGDVHTTNTTPIFLLNTLNTKL